MQLSPETIQVLKNFSTINQSVLIEEGNRLRTVSVMKNILAEAQIVEEFPVQVPIYDLSQFLNSLSLVDGANLEFGESSVMISNGSTSIEYRYSDPSVITSPPNKTITLPSEDVYFTLYGDVLQRIIKASSVLQLPDLALVGSGGVLSLELHDKKQSSSSNRFRVEVGSVEDDVNLQFRIENLKVLPGDYDVIVSNKLISRWSHHSIPVSYWIALEP
jgi:hypothetical protein